MTQKKIRKQLNRDEAIHYIKLLKEQVKRKAYATFKLFAKEYIWISNKQGETVNFELNEAQEYVEREVKRIQRKGKPVRIIVLKARQLGISLYVSGKMIKETTTQKNKAALIVSHRGDSTKALFSRLKAIVEALPENVKPLQRASNSTELLFDRPRGHRGVKQGLHAKVQVQTAGSEGIGRSEPHQYVHASELGFWEGDVKKQLGGIMASVPKTPDTWVIIESTANGMNYFYDLCMAAMNDENDWEFIFLPWHMFKEYSLPFSNPEEREVFKNTKISKYMADLMINFSLTLEQLHWWWYTYTTEEGSDLNMMRQEFPSTPEEAFIMSGTPVFEMDVLMALIQTVRGDLKKNPPITGDFKAAWHNEMVRDYIDSSKFIKRPSGMWEIYELPKKNRTYAIGGDTAGDGSDQFSICIVDAITGREVAMWHGKISEPHYVEQVYCAGMFYNYALIGIEINFNTYPRNELTRLGYHNQYKRESRDEITKVKTTKLGYKTGLVGGTNTRQDMISDQITMLMTRPDTFKSVATLNEMLTFVYDKNMRPDHMPGKHDDALMGSMIARAVAKQQTKIPTMTEEDKKRVFISEHEREDTMKREYGNKVMSGRIRKATRKKRR